MRTLRLHLPKLPRFSLRSLLMIVLLVAAFFGGWVANEQWHQQYGAVAIKPVYLGLKPDELQELQRNVKFLRTQEQRVAKELEGQYAEADVLISQGAPIVEIDFVRSKIEVLDEVRNRLSGEADEIQVALSRSARPTGAVTTAFLVAGILCTFLAGLLCGRRLPKRHSTR